MLKRILSIMLCLSIFLFSLCCYAPVSVKADVSIYDKYKTIYENYDFSSIISQHKSFNFVDKGGTKHPISYCVGGGWNYYFGRGGFIKDDVTLNYFLSWYAYKGYSTDNKSVGAGLLSMVNSKLGLVADVSSSIMESVLLSRSDIDFEYDDTDGLTVSSDSVDKLREEIKKQYYASIGMLEVTPSGNVKTLLSKSGFKAMFEQTDDYNDTYARVNNYAYAFVCGYEFSSMTCYRTFFMNELPKYLYLDTTDTKGYSYSDSWYKCYRLSYYDDTSHAFSFNNSIDVYTYHYADTITPLSDMSLYYSFSGGFCYFPSFNTSDYNHSYYKEFMYFGNSSFWFFKSFEALYDYLHGSQNAYLSSKVDEAGEDIKISIDDMNTNISDKMDSLIDSINSKKDGMSADELQNAIDKGLESISGKMDDIKDNTEETNSKLDNLLSAMQSQNEILMNILGVTTDIYNVVSSKDKEDDTNYTIADLQPHFNKCFTAVKNMVLYGESSFEDVGTQSVMNVDNDVGIAVYVDDPENHVKDYHNGLLGKFPFCVPYQLYEWLQVLQADPKTPEFTYDYGYMLKYFGVSSDTDTVIKFDLSQYDDWAKNARSFLKLSFTLAVAVGTYRKFKGEI